MTASIKAEDNPISANGGVGFTIAETFPDPNLAQAVADQVSAGDTNVVLTQVMVDGLTSLIAFNKNISDITGIGSLSNLMFLDLADNQLTSLPPEIGNLSSLLQLSLSYNELTSIPAEIGNLSALDYLGLNNNRLSVLPAEIGNLIDLSSLSLHNNQLSSLPPEIGNLASVVVIELDSNQLTSLPAQIGNLSNLIVLSLFDNQLTSLPVEISTLSNLEYLELYDNQLTSLPTEISNLLSLDYMPIENNLLPDNYDTVLNTLGLNMSFAYEQQRQLQLKESLTPFTINSEQALLAIDLSQMVQVYDEPQDEIAPVSSGHTFILTDYVDENNNPVDIDDYIQNGAVVKEGNVFAKIRATDTGLFPNNSNHAVTLDSVQLNFVFNQYTLSFDLNGASGVAPVTQRNLLAGNKATAVPEPVRGGYTFLGWNTAADGSGTAWNFEATTMPANNVTLYAQWKKNEQPTLPETLPVTGESSVSLILSSLIIGIDLLVLTIQKKKR
ncbi:InlB B-repeat-containing protein [Culicoidibacter larvae]|uniref:InlB B-repeat-containing protein n=1 Tax=Culicoidibacter larvae TaxID=2579976 RepID=UPI001485119A|nr:InlB B-repeat-containing protein [Culicoidibacter larvae]